MTMTPHNLNEVLLSNKSAFKFLSLRAQDDNAFFIAICFGLGLMVGLKPDWLYLRDLLHVELSIEVVGVAIASG